MTHTIERPDWTTWFAEVGIDYVEVEACPEPACDVCRAEPAEVAAAA